MEPACQYPLCRRTVPSVLEHEGLCPLHFLRKVDGECSQIRRETIGVAMDGRRSAEINTYLSTRAMILAQLATSGTRLRDEARPCLLSVFLTLLNVCERLAKASDDSRPEPAMTGVRRSFATAMK